MRDRIVVDMHAHILPAVDDGARSLEESCALLERAFSQGVRAVIATPHNSRRISTATLREKLAQVGEEFCGRHPDFKLYAGQEILFHEEMAGRLKGGELLTLADSRYILVEFDTGISYGSLYRGIRSLTSAGYWPILAHMERYGCLRQEKNLTDLTGSGCLFQMNYESLQGSRFKAEVRWCRRQVLKGGIHLLGTDMHRMDYRPPDLADALGWLEGHMEEGLIDDMTRGNPLRVIKGEGIQ